jgi:fructose/tagatose bisphosphate aldolase
MALYTMKELLADAQARRYGVGFFNTPNQEMLLACIEVAEERRSPVIVGTAGVAAQILGFRHHHTDDAGRGEADQSACSGAPGPCVQL